MTADNSASDDQRAEKTRDEEKSLTPTATMNGSKPNNEVGDGNVPSTDSDPPAPEEKRPVTGLKVC